jgi:hypothetical protein
MNNKHYVEVSANFLIGLDGVKQFLLEEGYYLSRTNTLELLTRQGNETFWEGVYEGDEFFLECCFADFKAQITT